MTNPTNPLSAFVVPNSDPTHYTPTTGDVRTSYGVAASFPMQSLPERRRSFDRWLAGHEAALVERLANELDNIDPNHDAVFYVAGDRERGYHSVTEWMREIASAIRALKEEKK